MGRQCVPGEEGGWLPSLRKDRDDWSELAKSLGTLFSRGFDVNWAGFDRPYPRRKVVLPSYPFERQRYWIEVSEGDEGAPPDRERPEHPGRGVGRDLEAVRFESLVGPQALPYLADHRIYGAVVLPATAYLEMGLAAAAETLGAGAHVLEDVVISEALVLSPGEDQLVRVSVTREETGPAGIEIRSRARGAGAEAEWRLHASCRVRQAAAESPSAPEALSAIQARCGLRVRVEEHYEALRQAGVDFGRSFRGLVDLWAGEGEAVGRVRLPEAAGPGTDRYRFHPALLDACLQTLSGARKRGEGPPGVYLPLSLERMRLHAPAEADVWSHVRIRPGNEASGQTIVADFWALDEAGRAVASLEGLRFMRATAEALRRAAQPPVGDWLYEVAWRAHPLTGTPSLDRTAGGRSWVALADADGVAESLARRWRERGDRVVVVKPGEAFVKGEEGTFYLDPASPEDFRRLLREASAGSLLAGVVHLWGLGATRSEGAPALSRLTTLSWGSLLPLAQALAEAGPADPPRLWVVTRGTQALAGSVGMEGLAQAASWGLARTIAAEHPELGCTRLDLDGERCPQAVEPRWAAIDAGHRGRHLAYRH